jgi:hypothetical protein
MTSRWGNLDCPECGCPQASPRQVDSECESLVGEVVCPECDYSWEVRLELWRYYGIDSFLPSRAEDK